MGTTPTHLERPPGDESIADTRGVHAHRPTALPGGGIPPGASGRRLTERVQVEHAHVPGQLPGDRTTVSLWETLAVSRGTLRAAVGRSITILAPPGDGSPSALGVTSRSSLGSLGATTPPSAYRRAHSPPRGPLGGEAFAHNATLQRLRAAGGRGRGVQSGGPSRTPLGQPPGVNTTKDVWGCLTLRPRHPPGGALT